ncbi:MAG: hypothetical protein Q8N99_01885 [Nanoarchaeota archaeon]|nr:hypothetical protein [Nanoarchaeota archaeon]
MTLKKILASLLIAGSIFGSNSNSSKSQDIIITSPIITYPIYPPLIIEPRVICPIYPPLIIEPVLSIYVYPNPVLPMPPTLLRKVFNLKQLVDTATGQDLFIKYSNKRIYEEIGTIPSAAWRIMFVKDGIENLVNNQVQELPAKGWEERWINRDMRVWTRIKRKKRDYRLSSLLNPNESYEVYAEIPNRALESGNEWKKVGKINPGGDRMIFSDNGTYTAY